MPVNRPGFTPTAKDTLGAMKDTSRYIKFPPGTHLVRFMPPPQKSLFVAIGQHFNLKSPEGNNIALACLQYHGTDETGKNCWLCDLVEWLKTQDSKELLKLTKGQPGLQAKVTYAAQCYEGEKQSDGKFNWIGPKLTGLSEKWAKGLISVLDGQEYIGDVPFTDADEGQPVIITRTGTKFDTNYTFQLSNRKECLDDVVPGWQERWIADIVEFQNLRLASRELQRECVKQAYGDLLDWALVDEEVPV